MQSSRSLYRVLFRLYKVSVAQIKTILVKKVMYKVPVCPRSLVQGFVSLYKIPVLLYEVLVRFYTVPVRLYN